MIVAAFRYRALRSMLNITTNGRHAAGGLILRDAGKPMNAFSEGRRMAGASLHNTQQNEAHIFRLGHRIRHIGLDAIESLETALGL
jgi:hypothetical protein